MCCVVYGILCICPGQLFCMWLLFVCCLFVVCLCVREREICGFPDFLSSVRVGLILIFSYSLFLFWADENSSSRGVNEDGETPTNSQPCLHRGRFQVQTLCSLIYTQLRATIVTLSQLLYIFIGLPERNNKLSFKPLFWYLTAGYTWYW